MIDQPTRMQRLATLLGAHERMALAAVLFLGLLIRLPFVTTDPRIIADPALLVDWAGLLQRGGLAELIGGTGAMVLYPPLAMLGIWFGGVLGEALPPALFGDAGMLVVVKSMGVAGDIGLAWLVAGLLAGRSAIVRVAGAAAIAFNPAFWYLSAVWGQIDSVYVLLMVASVAALAAGRRASAWAAWAASLLWKLQAVTLAPIVVVRTLRTSGWRGAAEGIVVASGVAVIASALLFRDGGWDGYASRLWSRATPLDVSAFNAWYLASTVMPGREGLPAWLPALGVVLLGAIVLLVASAMWRRSAAVGLALPAAIATLATFTVFIGMHERYLLGALPFVLLLACGWEDHRIDRPAGLAFVALSATQTLNLVAVGSFAPSLWINVFSDAPNGPLGPPIAALGLAAAATNLAVLAWALRRVIERGWRTGLDGPSPTGSRVVPDPVA